MGGIGLADGRVVFGIGGGGLMAPLDVHGGHEW